MKNATSITRNGITMPHLFRAAIILILFLFSSNISDGQSHRIPITLSNITYHRDTTFLDLHAENYYSGTTSSWIGGSFSSTTVYTWTFSDSTTQVGQDVTRAFTGNRRFIESFIYTVTAVDTASGITVSGVESPSYPEVLNCSFFDSLSNNVYPSSGCGTMEVRVTSVYSLYGSYFPRVYTMDWGDGTTSVDSEAYSGIFHEYHGYPYGGVYKIRSSLVVMSPDRSLSCPVIYSPLEAKFVGSHNPPPAISGSLTVCEGDTLRLTAYDTTAFFHSLFGITDLTGTDGHIDSFSGCPAREFNWGHYSPSNNYLFEGSRNDSVLVYPNILADDTTFTFFSSTEGEFGGYLEVHVNVIRSTLPPISGPMYLCSGRTYTYSNAVSGGTWTCNDPSVATVNPTTGVLTAIGTGTAQIRYYAGTGCPAIKYVTVDAASIPQFSISTIVSLGSVVAMSDSGSSGTWGTSNSAIASVDGSGNVYAIANGYALITSTISTGCITVIDSITVFVGTTSAFSGILYRDENGTCTFDASETRLRYWEIAMVNNTTGDTSYTWCNSVGMFSVNLHDGENYSIIPDYYRSFGLGGDSLALSCPSTAIYTITPTFGHTYSQDFGFTCHGTLPSLDMNVSGFGSRFVPGRTTSIYISSSNSWGYMCDSLNASVTLQLDASLTYAGMSTGPSPTSVSGHTIVWDFHTTGSLLDFTGTVSVTTASSAHVGDTVTNTIQVNTIGIADPDTTDNTYSWSARIRGSYDPNELEVSPKGYDSEGYIANETPLSYMVHFQNTGTDTAYDVAIYDTLAPTLDIATLQLISSSHEVVLSQVGTTNIVKFSFSNISLPDSGTNLSASNGFVSFNIQPRPNLAANTTINNTAHIYFDANPPVATNAVLNTIEDSLRAISGPSTICAGSTITLTNAITGGVWRASNGHAMVVGGVVTAISAGIDTISYSMYGGEQIVTKVITVNPLPVAGTITSHDSVCVGATTVLTSTGDSGGYWSISSATIATFTTLSAIVGVYPGWTGRTYTVVNSCGVAHTTDTMVFRALPNAGTITGATTVCVGAVTTLSATTGGTWGISSSSTARVSSAGVVTGIAAGSSTISYTVTNSCGTDVATSTITVNPLPVAGTITGTTTVCAGAITPLSVTSGGAWSSSSSSTASISSAGVVIGITAGSATMSYTVTNGCGTDVATTSITVNPLPVAATVTGGASTLCAGATTTFSTSTSGGVWISSNPSRATVSGGVVTAVAAGIDTILYTVSNSCGTAATPSVITITTGAIAGTLTGPDSVCVGASIAIAPTVSGGIWSSGSIGTISSGTLTGVAAGRDTVYYIVTNTCGTAVVRKEVIIKALAVAGTISGASSVCTGASATLTNSVAGGLWATADASVASVSTTGTVSGLTVGSVNISYSVTNSCGTVAATRAIGVNTIPVVGVITGAATVCAGADTSLANSAAGGVWSSSNTSIASVSASGNFTGVNAGTATIAYRLSNACGTDVATLPVTVNPIPVAGTITGPDSICNDADLVLTGATAGGAWHSSNGAIMSVTSTGHVHPLAPGASVISYVVTNPCGTATATHSMVVRSSAACNTGIANSATIATSIEVYPNPNHGEFTIAIQGNAINVVVTITDVAGKVVTEIHPKNATDLKIPVNLGNVAPGAYLLRVNVDGKMYHDKLILW